MTMLTPVQHATKIQQQAANPDLSVWVSANAGSGKTHVLVQRVIRLLLDGVAPARILALTYTKAAAANMATKVFDTLAGWVVMDDARLAAELVKIEDHPPAPVRLELARQLFAKAVETPGGLKIQTIHAFCEKLLHLFPFEANVAARFEVLDDAQKALLLAQAREDLLRGAITQPDQGLARALSLIADLMSEGDLTDLIKEAMILQNRLGSQLQGEAAIEAMMDRLRAEFLLGDGDTVEALTKRIGPDDGMIGTMRQLQQALAAGSKNDQKMADKIAYWLRAAQGQTPNATQLYCAIFTTKEGALSAENTLMTKPAQKLHPALYDLLMGEYKRVGALLGRRKNAEVVERSRAILLVSDAVQAHYARSKASRGALDFDDLIERTHSLLLRSDAAWVLFKLDQGIDHLLVDEAQDTSPLQWDILKSLTGEFFSGEGARQTHRTVFAVGDPKQSIYSFQGADPRAFAESRDHFEALAKNTVRNGKGGFMPVKLEMSFRSSGAVLEAVDRVFRDPAHHDGLERDSVAPVHQARRGDLPGFVDIWPLVKPEKDDVSDEWVPSLKPSRQPAPPVQVADQIAAQIAQWCSADSTERISATGSDDRLVQRRIMPGDILILVRKRSGFFEAMIRALKNRHVPVAGADRLSLTDHIAVMDLMALGRAALLPDDDLTLAALLKSPLFGLNDDDLLVLAPHRTGSLYQAWREHPVYRSAFDRFESWRLRAVSEGPFSFYASVLSADRGRETLLGRLGAEAADAIDAFLNAAQSYEMHHSPSLQGFLLAFSGTKTEIKRDMEAGRNEVRVMTVHGAKGLEAPIVFLPDTVSLRDQTKTGHFPLLNSESQPPLAVWARSKKTDPDQINLAREAGVALQLKEYRRLLYVALTRARERLYVAGFQGSHEPKPECWYEMIRRGLGDDLQPVPEGQGPEGSLRFAPHGLRPSGGLTDQAGPQEEARIAARVPDWLRRDVVREDEVSPPVRPSHALNAADRSDRPLDTPWQKQAQMRGTLVHSLLELLPACPADKRKEVARLYLRKSSKALSASDLPAHDLDSVIAGCLALLDDPRFAPLFGPTSRAEVSIAGAVAFGPDRVMRKVSGQIDRLAVLPDRILVADYKTSLSPPKRIEDIDPTHVLQLALYSALLQSLYPDKPVEAFVLYTAGHSLWQVPDHLLDQALS